MNPSFKADVPLCYQIPLKLIEIKACKTHGYYLNTVMTILNQFLYERIIDMYYGSMKKCHGKSYLCVD